MSYMHGQGGDNVPPQGRNKFVLEQCKLHVNTISYQYPANILSISCQYPINILSISYQYR